MTVFDELKARGLLAQLTDEEEIKELINNGKATFYIGFDPREVHWTSTMQHGTRLWPKHSNWMNSFISTPRSWTNTIPGRRLV